MLERTALALVLAISGFTGTLGQEQNSAFEPDAGPLLSLADGDWLLAVDRGWRGLPYDRLPSDPLDEEDYVALESGPTYRLTVSDGGARVAFADSAKVARRTGGDRDHADYEMTEGTFAGGRLRVWSRQDGSLEAELTIYGSGVPILSSGRGSLRPASD